MAGKSDLTRGLEELENKSEEEEEELHTPKSTMSNNYSMALSLPPTLPSSPTECDSVLVQTPLPLHETPVIPVLPDQPPALEEVRHLTGILLLDNYIHANIGSAKT
jgi:hypothetical protein